MSQENNGEDLRCGVCLKSYRDARHLNCLHAFCLDCLQDHVKKHNWKKTLLCPLCNKEMILPKGGVGDIPRDYYVRAKLEIPNLKETSECEMCQDHATAKFRCLDCEINLCRNCKPKHAGPESSQVHHFLGCVENDVGPNKNVPNGTKTPGPKKMSESSGCTKHSGLDLNVYCTKCKLAVCEKCKDEKHRSHPMQATERVAKSTRSSLSHFLGAIKAYLPDYEEYAKKVRNSQKELDKDLDNAVKDIQARCRFLQKEIDKIGQQLIDELKAKHKAETDDLGKEVKQIVNSYKSVATVASSADRMLKLGSDLNLLDASNRVQKRFMQIEDELPALTISKINTVGFVPGGLKALGLPSMFGQCTKGEISLPLLPIPWGIRLAKDFDIRSIASFRVRNSTETVQSIAPVSDTEAWVSCGWGTKDALLYTIDGEKKRRVTLDIQIDHMCVTPTGDLLVSSYEDKYIKKVNKQYEVVDFAFPHLHPGGMVMTKRKELFVCAVDSYTTRRAPHSDRCLMKLSEHGMNIDAIDEYGDTILFGAPYRVSEAPHKHLCVTDREEGKLRVTMLDQDGVIKFVYTGPKEIKLENPFNPLGLCCDRAGNLLVCDWGNHCVHLVNSDGDFKGFMLTQKDGLFKPNAMALDKNGNLWIGDGNSTVRVYKYEKRVFG